VADKAANLGTAPAAIVKRRVDVVLSDGTVMTVHKWSWPKYQKLWSLVGNTTQALTIAQESVAEADRQKVETLDPDDIASLAVAATDLNITETTRKNLKAQLRQSGEIADALGVKPPPPPPTPSKDGQ
jgi:hypothetical protein